MRRDKQKSKADEFNALLDPDSEVFKNDDGTRLLEEYKKSKRGQAMGLALGPLSFPASLLLKRNSAKIEKAYIRKMADMGIGEEEAKKQLDEISMGSALKEGITSPFKDEKGERLSGAEIMSNLFGQGYYDKYEPQYSVGSFLGGNDSSLKGFERVNGMPSGNLDARQQQHFDNAIRDGNYSTAEHFSRIAKLNQRRDEFAIDNAADIRAIQKMEKGSPEYERAFRQLKNKSTGGMKLGDFSIEMVIELGSSHLTAINKGKAKKEDGIFGKVVPIDNTPITSTDPSPSPSSSSNNNDRDRKRERREKRKQNIKKADKKISEARSKGKLSKTSFRKADNERGFVGGFNKGGLMEKDK